MSRRPALRPRHPAHRGFTMIELVIVMAMLGLLLSLALPQYMAALDRGREQVLQHNLATMREAIDKFYGDRGRYPDTLDDLVTQRYLRAIPNDPFSEQPTWIVVAPRDGARGGVIDVQSTRTDAAGGAREPAAAPAGEAAPLPGLVQLEGGDRRIVTAAVAASAPEAEALPQEPAR